MSKNSTIPSPITKGKTTFLFDIPKNEIIKWYLSESGIEVQYLFEGIQSVSLYQCNDTSYRFFHPFNIDGDGPFYEKLENISWYYADWKWDYEIGKDFIQNNSTVLDIGCGEAKFLTFLKTKKNCNVVGLELNSKAQEIAVNNGINVNNESIQEYALGNKSKFDVVTFFQVLEHISNVDSFLKAALEVTKTGGLVILAVPNNEPYYLTFDKYHFLNLPPHHMGWWDEKSLRSLGSIYNLELIELKKQPLEHYSAYANGLMIEKYKIPSNLAKVLRPFVKLLVYLFRKKINGASIMVVFKKV